MAAFAWAFARTDGATVAPAAPCDLANAVSAVVDAAAHLLGAKSSEKKGDGIAPDAAVYLFGPG